MTGLDHRELARVARTMTAAGTPPRGELSASLIAGGRSNLTFLLADEDRRWVLRTPPRQGRTPSAHDVLREHRVTSALSRTTVPVPTPVCVEDDESLIGGPFLVADFVAGHAIRTRGDLEALSSAELDGALDGMLECLAALHDVDHVAVGLEAFGRPEGYAARQLRRWSGQWQRVGVAGLASLQAAAVDAIAGRLPRQGSVGIVHGDFRIDNVLLSGSRVAAVVDWELSTIGDPVADVAMMCAYQQSPFDLVVGEPSAWTSDRIPDSDELAAAYVAAGGVDLVDWESHLALAYLKIATIAAGIAHRHKAGAATGPGFETAGEAIEPFLELAIATLASRLGGPTAGAR